MELSSSRPHRAIMQRSDPLLSNIPLVPYPRLPSPAIAVLALFQRCFGGRPRKPCGKTKCPRQSISITETGERENLRRISRPRTAIGGAFHARRGFRTKTTCTTNITTIRRGGGVSGSRGHPRCERTPQMWCGTHARRTEGIGTILLQVITCQHPLASGGTQQHRQPGLEAKIQELLEAKVQWRHQLEAKIQELMEAKVQWRHHQV